MNRPLEFRAWSKTYNKFIDLENLTEQIATANPWCRMSTKGIFLPLEKHIILQQFTGLFDKNGVKVFEGDILDVDGLTWDIFDPKNPQFYFVYLHSNGDNRFIYGLSTDLKNPTNHLIHNIWKSNNVKIVGNIFENKNLLK